VPLVITMGNAAPIVGANIFSTINGSKHVTVSVPAGATGYTSIWQNAFKGLGSDGTGTVNNYINLAIQYY
jgi:hypothetical protein